MVKIAGDQISTQKVCNDALNDYIEAGEEIKKLVALAQDRTDKFYKDWVELVILIMAQSGTRQRQTLNELKNTMCKLNHHLLINRPKSI
jgi:intergrase/recombinase